MNQEQLRELMLKRSEKLDEGIKSKRVFMLSKELFDRLRPFTYRGIPLSICLFIPDLCNGDCYVSSLLAQLAFKNCKRVYAEIETLRLMGKRGARAQHAFLVTKLDDGKQYVIDVSAGLAYEKEFFAEFEKPKVNKVFNKKECVTTPLIRSVVLSNRARETKQLLRYLPFVEKTLRDSNDPITEILRPKLEQEIENLKKQTNYLELQKQYGITDEEMLRYDNSMFFTIDPDFRVPENAETDKLLARKLKAIFEEPTRDFYD